MTARTKLGTALVPLLITAIVAVPSQRALALIFGGVGNTPIQDPGWPDGAAVVFNTKSRIAYWEGPPLGGGQWHAECQGNAKALNAVLADFAKLDVKAKRVVLHDGFAHSRWINIKKDPAKREAGKIDWEFMVWVPASWNESRKLPADRNPIDANDAEPPAQLDIYTGGNVKWADVIVPKGLKIIDQRLEAHGFTLTDGLVFEGKVTDLATKQPLVAKVRLERIDSKPKGGYDYVNVAQAETDADGRWVVKKAPQGWLRVVVEAKGYVSRVVGHDSADDQPRWRQLDGGLSRPGPVEGRVTDDAGDPLADVEVRVSGLYESAAGSSFKTNKDGRFRADQVPIGKATIWVHKPGYIRPGLGDKITTPTNEVALYMIRAASVEVTVDFTGKQRPEGYIVRMEPEGGDRVGSYGGSGNINAKNQMTFDHVPPGRYFLCGRPNPGADDQETDSIAIDLRGGQAAKVTLKAR